MKASKLFDMIQVDEFSSTPKYLQLTNAILNAISAGKLQKDDPLPSINELSYQLEISRDTAEKGYRYLKKIGVLASVPGKGYFIRNTAFRQTLKICLLFNKLSAHKKIIYDAFVEALGEQVAIDFYIYNNDFSLFKKILLNKKGEYSHYVIIPHFLEGGEHAFEIINTIPPEKLLLLDKILPDVKGEYAAVYENFADDIYNALEKALEPLSKYRTIKIIFPRNSYYPVEIQRGVNRFCQDYAFNYKVVHRLADESIEEGEVYIILMEDDLVMLIERLISLQLKVGEQVGVISYNETPLKKIILNGITTVSTDFRQMGASAARMILDNERRHLEIPFHLTLRSSL
ncbi:substrate-binding protein-like domain-containing protein [Chitinophaga costaii]|uniref:Substrate-binding protein-like domain-containing protein n=1 Tax=Chitinophaga costaii TaxID=1335309 RepID=A0A1C4C8K7_9BACT|nr:GntR family transcriptional regulator [Chitinophaga costaii]PUZ27193.1 transcriptional regulator [Chitinophaga costaii]SCC15333.1 substrate-binding protein-like domain-containing protein [Chitinophaga costaii]